MGRNRSFIEHEVLTKCAAVFLATGYEGTSIDELVTASGLHRGSLYQAFGSKRGLFLAVLKQLASSVGEPSRSLDLVLVALVEVAPRDAEVRLVTADILAAAGERGTPASLGARLLDRAHIDTAST